MHRYLFLILVLYTIVTGLNSSTIPLSKAPDEYVHFLYGRFIATQGRLPITAEERQSAGYKSDQPPLYYGLLALVMAGVDDTPPPKLKMSWDSPRRYLIDLVLPRAMIVRTQDETWPYRGEILAWRLGRWLSILLGNLTLIVVYLTVLELFPHQKWLAWSATATIGLMPSFTFISAVLSDENLLGLIIALYFWLLIRLLKSPTWSVHHFIGLGTLIGLAIITKYSAVVLPLEGLLLLIALKTNLFSAPKSIRWAYLASAALACILITGFWVIFQTRHFNRIAELGGWAGIVQPLIAGDETEAGSTTFFLANAVSSGATITTTAATEGSFFDWSRTFFTRLWYIEIVGRPPLYPIAYILLLTLTLTGAAMLGWGKIWQRNTPTERGWLFLLGLHGIIFLLIPVLRYFITGRIHDTAQARYLVCSAAPAVGLLLAWGIAELAGPRYDRPALLFLVASICGLSLMQGYHYQTGFPPPLPVRTGLTADSLLPVSYSFADGLELRGYSISFDYILTLHWHTRALTHEDYRTEISLFNQTGQLVSQTTAHPAQGRYPTRAWDIGDEVYDDIPLPITGLPQGTYRLKLRLMGWHEPLDEEVDLGEFNVRETFDSFAFPIQIGAQTVRFNLDTTTEFRYLAAIPISLSHDDLTPHLVSADGQEFAAVAGIGQNYTFVVAHDWPSGQYRLKLTSPQNDYAMTDPLVTVENKSFPFTAPPMSHMLEANFGTKIKLLGYDLPSTRVQPGSGLPLVLYWQGLQQMSEDYVIFNHLLDVNQRSWGGYDRFPKENYPTSLWVAGEVVADGFAVPVAADAPEGIYYLHIGFYLPETNATLPLIQQGQPIETTHVTIGPIKVGHAPDGATVKNITPQYPRSDMLGQIMRLQGYDIITATNNLTVTLYWQSNALTTVDYTTFAHLLDAQGQIIAQKDAPPGGGLYPTSLWEVGEIIADPIPLTFPANTHPTTLDVGLYRLDTGERLGMITLTLAH